MATAFDIGAIDGEEVVAISTGAFRVSGSGEISLSGRVLLLHADDTVETNSTHTVPTCPTCRKRDPPTQSTGPFILRSLLQLS